MVSIAPAVASLLVAQPDWDNHMDWDGGWWVLMVIGMVLFWALVIVAIVWVVRELSSRRAGQPTGSAPPGEDPLAILDRRLAEGTITVDEYEERRAILVGRPPTDSS